MKAWFLAGTTTLALVTGCWDSLTLGTDPSGGGVGGASSSSSASASSSTAVSSSAVVSVSSSAGTGGGGTGGAGGVGGAGGTGGGSACTPEPGTIFEFSMQPLDGTAQPVNMCEYRGKVLLIVNTASKCTYTPQYAALQGVHSLYEPQGFEVLGYYSNDFGQAGTPGEIDSCNSQYMVTFDQFGVFVVTETLGQHPLFDWLTHQPPPLDGPVTYNFNKFLVARDGTLVNRWSQTIEPNATEVLDAINVEIAKP